MIILITGKNGTGKSLYAVRLLYELEKKNKQFLLEEKDDQYRQIFTNITDLSFGEKIDLDYDWREAPPGSVIVYDEAQRAFPPRAHTKSAPEIIMDMTEHRKEGKDIYFITQHPTFLDHMIRQLVGLHHHITRPFNAPYSNVYTDSQSISVEDKRALKNCDQKKVKHSKEHFELYQSAQIHNQKMYIPRKIAIGLSLLFAMAVYFFYKVVINPPELFADDIKTTEPDRNDKDKNFLESVTPQVIPQQIFKKPVNECKEVKPDMYLRTPSKCKITYVSNGYRREYQVSNDRCNQIIDTKETVYIQVCI